MLDTGSSNGPSTKVGFNLPSYSNLLNMSCMNVHQELLCQIIKVKGKKIDKYWQKMHACNDITALESNGGASETVLARNTGLREENGNCICKIWQRKTLWGKVRKYKL